VPAIAAQYAQRPLDALNFFLADVRDGLGPYLAIYLLTEQKWNEASRRRDVDCRTGRNRGSNTCRGVD